MRSYGPRAAREAGAWKQTAVAVSLPLRPRRGGFMRAFGCGWFIKELLLGNSPGGSPAIDPNIGAPQTDMFFQYKTALIMATAEDRATRHEERQARREKRAISPDNIETLAKKYLARMPFKGQGACSHSFVVYFSNLRRLGWVEASGIEEPSVFQEHYPPGQPRRFYRLTAAGMSAPESGWANPHRALYG